MVTQMKMTKRAMRARYRAIVHELSRLSRVGWALAKPSDYLPLEAELRALAVKIHAGRLKPA